ncbi:glycosyltransferase [Echinicola sp. CAU 1574]|uniref:Glycosyltransferase n=1 Tax=Echinicola arenosa TaxID=2774144 RepID=A0ABR9ARC0_9BACT|nr:glycosyltransferase [Echinicola arenosa]MBD8490413.1 glycosyltransferase [Echinicola arenosa]
MGMNLLAFFFFGALVIYLAILVMLAVFWRKSKGKTTEKMNIFDYPVTLLVPFRNEKSQLPKLLESLEKLTYPSLQVILIDDDSEDGGAEYVESWIKGKSYSHFLMVQSQEQGKKGAIEQGVVLSNGYIILTTDADCVLPTDWVENMLQPFNDPKVQMVAGPVMSEDRKSNFNQFQQIEWSSILLMTNFFFQINKPIMCSAANMGYRKEAFQHLGGYQGNSEQRSGDDSFLLEKMVRAFGHHAIHYFTDKKVLVRTKAQKSWSLFLAQRARWISKWNQHQSMENAFGAVVTAGFSLASLLSPLLLLGSGWMPLLFLLYWVLKLGVEYVVMNKVLEGYEIKAPFLSFIYASFCHPCFVIVVALSSFFGKFKWKGR